MARGRVSRAGPAQARPESAPSGRPGRRRAGGPGGGAGGPGPGTLPGNGVTMISRRAPLLLDAGFRAAGRESRWPVAVSAGRRLSAGVRFAG